MARFAPRASSTITTTPFDRLVLRELLPAHSRSLRMKTSRLLLFALLLGVWGTRAELAFPQGSFLYGQQPGPAIAEINKFVVLKNSMLTAKWSISSGRLNSGSFAAPPGAVAGELLLGDAFLVRFADGKSLKSSSLQITDVPRLENFDADPNASRLEEHFPGK